jgi:hypothetical protein
MRRNHRLRLFAGGEIGTEPQPDDASPRLGDGEFQRRAGMPMPDLDCINAVPVRALAPREQEIDRRRVRAPIAACKITKCLAEMAALGMRLQAGGE